MLISNLPDEPLKLLKTAMTPKMLHKGKRNFENKLFSSFRKWDVFSKILSLGPTIHHRILHTNVECSCPRMCRKRWCTCARGVGGNMRCFIRTVSTLYVYRFLWQTDENPALGRLAQQEVMRGRTFKYSVKMRRNWWFVPKTTSA